MPEPVSLIVGGWVLGGLLGNQADRAFCATTRKVQDVFLSGGKEPRNHDLAIAIRRAQLLALRMTVRAYEDMPHAHWRTLPGYSPSAIADPLTMWIRAELIKGAPSPSDLSDKVSAQIERVFTHPPPHEGGVAARQAELRRLAEDWALEEAKAQVQDVADWARFERLLHEGGDTPAGRFPGWWPLFRAFMAEEVKRDEKVSRILAEQGIAEILELQTDLAEAVEALQEGLERVIAKMDEALEQLRTARASMDGAAERVDMALQRLDRAFEDSQRRWSGLPGYSGRVDVASMRDRITARPTELLIARYRVVPFLDRDGILDSALAWARDAAGARARGRLYEAPGGFGKTRLGVELIVALEQLGWRCTFFSQVNAETITPGALSDFLRTEDAAGVCVVVDYAEGQIERLRRLADAAARADKSGPPIRILAIARSSAGWWDAFAGDPSAAIVFDPIPFGGIASGLSHADRAKLFASARAAFLEQLRAHGVEAEDRNVSAEPAGNYDRPLAVVAAAYLSARGLRGEGQSLFETLYQEERRHWRRILDVEADDAPEMDEMGRAAAQLTLVQGATEDGLRVLLKSDTADRVLKIKDLAPKLRRLYGRTLSDERGQLTYLGPIEPDLLGEHASMRVLSDDRDDLAVKTLQAALGGAPLFDEDAAAILTVLVRAMRPEHHPSVKSEAEAAISAIQSAVGGMAREQVERFNKSLPFSSTALLELSVTVAGRVVELRPFGEDAAGKRARAAALNDLGVRLSNLGRREAALKASEEAVALARELLSEDPALARPGLATALNNLGNNLSDLGRLEEALQATEEAVALRHALVATSRDAFLPALATSLNNLGNRLSDVGRHMPALKASEEAVEFYRELSAKHRDFYLPDLAMGLNNLAGRHFALGRKEEALKASREAVELRRELAHRNPDAFLSDLGSALTNLANCLSAMGERHREAAEKVNEEAVGLYRALVAKNREAFVRSLASALNNWGNRLSELDRREDALTVSQEAVALRRELAVKNRKAFLPDLAGSLTNMGNRLADLQRYEEALKASEEGVEFFRELLTTNCDGFAGRAATAMSAQGDILVALNRYEEATASYAEAARLLKPYVVAVPAALGPLWLTNMRDLSRAMQASGRTEQDIDVVMGELGAGEVLAALHAAGLLSVGGDET